MPNYISRLMQAAPAVRAMLSVESRIGLDFSGTHLPTILIVMSCLIESGIDTAPAIHRYLGDRRCGLDRETIDFLLGSYDGEDPKRHLWERDFEGEYSVIRQSDRAMNDGDLPWPDDGF